MQTERSTVKKLKEWLRRYLPLEIAGTIGEFGGAGIAYLYTGSLAAAAIVATVGASVGYYATAYASAVRNSHRAHPHLPRVKRMITANWLSMRSIAIEFGPAELIDSLLIRPCAFYLGPVLFGGMIVGWLFAKLLADVGFYVLAIFSYERFKGLLAVRRAVEEVEHGTVTTVATA
ncbi:MAG: hypothetical protein HYZ38_26755 [Mycobacterium sp.]|nr:hypothetical protein [Mycobacterium sp.]